MSLAHLNESMPEFLKPYIPKPSTTNTSRPFVTLTYAQSLDSRISMGHGIRTTISHPETKAMTHYLRYHHDGILIGSGTALADNPGLNCKYGGPTCYEHSPRPIILDGKQKWRFEGSKMQELFFQNQGKAPIIVLTEEPSIREDHVSYLVCPYKGPSQVDWEILMNKLHEDFNMKAIMVEGGASVINQLLLEPSLVDSLIITIGSTFLGKSGVEVSPFQAIQLHDVQWWTGSSDAVISARLRSR